MKKGATNRNQIVFRADADTRMGAGHIMRCLSLAQAWQDTGGRATFLTMSDSALLKDRLKSEGMTVENLAAQQGSSQDAAQTAVLAQHVGAAWVIVDGYHFDVGYQEMLNKSGVQLLVIDDMGRSDLCDADIVLNQNIHAGEHLYPNRKANIQLMLGTRYALLRREFRKWRQWKRHTPPEARNILVTLGGSDPDNATRKVMQALNHIGAKELEVAVVVGPSNPHISSLKDAAARCPSGIRLLHSAGNMAELMAWADIGISAAGSTLYEMAFMGLPGLVLMIADNQAPLAEELHKAGAVLNLGWQQNLSCDEIGRAIKQMVMDPQMRRKISLRGREMVDGKGVRRVMAQMNHRTLTFRKVCAKDCRVIWEWANDTDARSVSFTSEAIPWEEHVQWFSSKLSDPNCLFYIIKNGEGAPVGQVRYDLCEDEAVISISIDPQFRRGGYGSQAIRLLSQEVFNTSDVEIIHAYVKQDNEISAGAFLKSGFEKIGTQNIHGHQAIDLALMKEAMI